MRRSRVLTAAAITGAVVIVIDLLVKLVVRGALIPGESRDVVGGLLRLVHVENDGVAFGQFAGSPLLVGAFVAAALTALIAYFVTHLASDAIWLPTGLLLGGALANAADRLRGGDVTDFVKLPYWPAFNVADIAITGGVVLLVVVVDRDARAREREEQSDGVHGRA